MSEIIFKNGSRIKIVESPSTVRSKRSNFISFYCAECGDVHIGVPISEMVYIKDGIFICKTSLDVLLEEIRREEL